MSIKNIYIASILVFGLLFTGLDQVEAEQIRKQSSAILYLFSINGEFLSYDVGRKTTLSHGVLSGTPKLSELLPPYSDLRHSREVALLRVEQALFDQKRNALILSLSLSSGIDGDNNIKSLLLALKAGDLFSPLGYRFFDGETTVLLDSERSRTLVSIFNTHKIPIDSDAKISSSLEVLSVPKFETIQKIEESLPQKEFLLAQRAFGTNFSKKASLNKDGITIIDGLSISRINVNNVSRETMLLSSLISPESDNDIKRFYNKDIASGHDYLPFSISATDAGKVMLTSIAPKIESSLGVLIDTTERQTKHVFKAPLSTFYLSSNLVFEERLKNISGHMHKTGEIFVYNVDSLGDKPRRIFNQNLSGDESDHKFLCGSLNGYFLYLSENKYLLINLSDPQSEEITPIDSDIYSSSSAQCLFIAG